MKSKDWAFFAAGAVGTTVCLLFAILCSAIVILKPEIPTLPISAAQTPAPAPPLAAELRGVIYHDDFSSKAMSEANGWRFDSDAQNDKTWSPDKLTIAVKQANLRQSVAIRGDYKDFGIEVEAQPEDKNIFYGIEFRATNHSEKDKLYLFLAMPAGGYALEKRIDGKYVRPVPVEYTESPHLKRGASKNRLGVLAEGSTISLYINGNLVNTVSDNSIQSGNIGLFVGSGEGAWAQVDFGGVTVTSVEKAKQQWSTRLAGDPVPSNGIWFDDDFHSQMASTDKGWVFDATAESDRVWSPNKYTIMAKQKNLRPMSFPVGTFKDFAVEIEAQPEGDPKFVYGIVFRYGEQSGSASYYLFGVQPWSGQEGGWAYYLTKFIGGKSVDSWPVELRPSPHIEPGVAKNRLGVLAEGSTISLYINGRRVKTLSDESLSSGKVGIFVQSDDSDRAQVAFSRMTIYTVEKAKAEWGTPPAPVPGIVYREDFASKQDAENNGWEFGSTAKRDNLWSPNKFSIVVKQKGGTESNGPLYYDTFKEG